MTDPLDILAAHNTARLLETFTSEGLDLADLKAKCSEIVVIGSQAIDAPDAADWDLMVFTDEDLGLQNSPRGRPRPPLKTMGGLNYKVGSLDIVVVTPEMTEDPKWLGWELAGHAALYGRWQHGTPGAWTTKTFVSDHNIEFKAKLVRGLWNGYRKVHKILDANRRAKHRQKLRREIRRLRYLRAGLAVPPRQILDANPRPPVAVATT